MLAATILVPTHDHGPTLRFSVGSALAQTVDDLEVLIVGDGVDDEAREVVAELRQADERVRFFDNPKGPRHGELHRHRALAEARGRAVCYLSDDDLYLPEHVASVVAALDEADFVHAQPVRVEPNGTLGVWLADLSVPFYRELLLGGENRIPLSCGAHTLDLYRRLPHGWRTTPPPTSTDLYMWQQLLEAPGVRARPTLAATVLHFPSPDRRGWSLERRLEELSRWAERAGEPGFAAELDERAKQAVLAAAFELDQHYRAAHRRTLELEHAAAEAARAADAARRAATADAAQRAAVATAAAYERTVTFRVRSRLLALPLVARAAGRLRRRG